MISHDTSSTITMVYLRLFLLCLFSGVIMGNQVKPACPEEAQICEFYLEFSTTTTMTLEKPGRNSQVLDIDSDGQVYKLKDDCGRKTPIGGQDLSKVPFGDGSYKTVFVYNGTLPGPPIVVYEGQQVVVRLWNRMVDQGTTVHFHGLKQLNTPWMDGVSGVSQCDILPGERFTYRFLASPVGTHWYHSHYGIQRTSGAAGAIIVLEKNKKEQSSTLPKFDDDFYMVIQDWYREDNALLIFKIYHGDIRYPFGYTYPACYNATKQYDLVDAGTFPFVSALINGKGRYHGQDPRYPNPSYVPFEVFQVRKGGHFRFRVISAAMMFPLRVSIDNHQIHVIASDGGSLKPQVMDAIIVFNAERYDFYIKATDSLKVGNYWIRVETLEHKTQTGDSLEPNDVKAILRYEGAPIQDPTTTPRTCTKFKPCHTFNCPYTSEVTAEENIRCHSLTEFVLSKPEPALEPDEGEDVVEYFFHFKSPQIKAGVLRVPAINGIQHTQLVASPMTYPDAPDGNVKRCLFTSCDTILCRKCNHQLNLPLNKTIQFNFALAFDNPPGMVFGNDHPVHIHGHQVQVLKVAYPDYDPVTKVFSKTNTDFSCSDENCNTLVWTNKSWEGGRVPGLLKERAPVKDSFLIPVGGYTVVRFKTDNPGYWFMHCHIEDHAVNGMALIMKIGDESQMNAKPQGMRTCSNFLGENDIHDVQKSAEDVDESVRANIEADDVYKIPALALGGTFIIFSLVTVYLEYKLKQDK